MRVGTVVLSQKITSHTQAPSKHVPKNACTHLIVYYDSIYITYDGNSKLKE